MQSVIPEIDRNNGFCMAGACNAGLMLFADVCLQQWLLICLQLHLWGDVSAVFNEALPCTAA